MTSNCPYCGRELRETRESFLVGGQSVEVCIEIEECGCEQAVSERKRLADELDAGKRLEESQRYRDAQVPKRFQGSGVDVSGCLQGVLDGKWLYLYGGVGSGKTTFACSLVENVLEHGETALFTSSARMRGEIYSTNFTDNTETELFNAWCKPFLLVIDDLGKESDSERVVKMVFRVIDERYGEMKPTVITSNFKPSELAASFAKCGDMELAGAIVSRLKEVAEVIDFGKVDRRLK